MKVKYIAAFATASILSAGVGIVFSPSPVMGSQVSSGTIISADPGASANPCAAANPCASAK